MMKCKKCQSDEMLKIAIKTVDWNFVDGLIYIEEDWECLECNHLQRVEVEGEILSIN